MYVFRMKISIFPADFYTDKFKFENHFGIPTYCVKFCAQILTFT